MVVFTGGTFSMGAGPDGSLAPMRTGMPAAELSEIAVANVPFETVPWGSVPSMHLSFSDVLSLASRLRERLASPVILGAVVVQGTDAIEETSFALDILVNSSKPLVVTGAIHPFDHRSSDGPGNLREAIRCAGSSLLADHGTVVTFGGEIHSARDVIKVDSAKRRAFASPHMGRLGTVAGDTLIVRRAPSARPRLRPTEVAKPIPLITAVMDSDGFEMRTAVAGGAAGVVIAATGNGQTSRLLLREARLAMAQGVPVILSSRLANGRVEPTYGYEASGADWLKSGAISAGSLSGPKARVALSIALGANLGGSELREFFELWGTLPGLRRTSSTT